MRIIYSWGHHEEIQPFIKAGIREWINNGYDVTSINHRNELNVERAWPPAELDELYRKREKRLWKLYDNIRNLAESHDIFMVNYENVYHPEFIKSLRNIYTVLVSGDDPEGSDYRSKPCVRAFDHSFAWGVNFDKDTKITEKFLEWGAKKTEWWPYGIREDMYDPSLKEKNIYNKDRDIDIIYVGSLWLKLDRLTRLKRAFPHQMKIYGRNYLKVVGADCLRELKRGNFLIALNRITMGLWKVKELPEDNIIPLYQRSKIGINVHLSYGPGNTRLFQLPANGVMQICDCPEGLGEVFEIGKEVVTYHSIEEAIELTRYYLEHDEERKEIAAAGFKRVIKDYKRITTFSKAVEKIKKGMLEKGITHFKDGTPIKSGESE